MNRGYKISLSLAFMLSLFMVWSMRDNATIVQTALGAVFMAAIFFVVLGFGFSGVYYCFTNRRSPYPALLIVATLLTAFLVCMDYTVWDTTPTPTARQIVVESLFIGPFYVFLFFGVFSGIYWTGEKLSRLVAKPAKA